MYEHFFHATEADKDEILALYRSVLGTEGCVWTEQYPTMKEILFDLSRDALLGLRNDKGEIIGVISLDDDEAVKALPCWSGELEPAVEFSRLGVRGDYQNRGIAKKLFAYAMQEAKKKGFQGAHYLVCPTNERAVRAYRKLGFEKVGECEMLGHAYDCYERELSDCKCSENMI
ncbi:MAG: N-acetyltransferase [bacterium]|nr:N-acetyltransferase [bacterium]